MTDETTPKTAFDHLCNAPEKKGEDKLYSTGEALSAMKEYARQVAQQVRQQCADQARIIDQRVNITVATSTTTSTPEYPIQSFIPPEIDKESILSVNIDDFIK